MARTKIAPNLEALVSHLEAEGNRGVPSTGRTTDQRRKARRGGEKRT